MIFRVPRITRLRAVFALGIALATDAAQILLGPLGWTFADELLDVVTMVLETILIGFHPLLLPTFVVEFIPVVDMLPTWSACVALVLALRRRQPSPVPPSAGSSPPALPPPRRR